MTPRIPLGAAVFFCLLAAALATAVLVVRARTPDLVLEVRGLERGFTFSPETESGPNAARLRFFVRRSDPAARVAIVDSREDPVKTLDADVALEADEPVSYSWDGTTDTGSLAEEGRYRLAVELPESDREMVWPVRITLEREHDG